MPYNSCSPRLWCDNLNCRNAAAYAAPAVLHGLTTRSTQRSPLVTQRAMWKLRNAGVAILSFLTWDDMLSKLVRFMCPCHTRCRNGPDGQYCPSRIHLSTSTSRDESLDERDKTQARHKIIISFLLSFCMALINLSVTSSISSRSLTQHVYS